MDGGTRQVSRTRSIIFNDAMVRAILAGRKTQTRRPVRRPARAGTYSFEEGMAWAKENGAHGIQKRGPCDGIEWRLSCPYGQPGDRLLVREAWRPIRAWNGSTEGCEIEYRADGRARSFAKCFAVPATVTHWRPSIHMPHAVSRIALEVTAGRVEKLQEITIEGCRAEGMTEEYPAGEFAETWDAIYAARGQGWDADPWVWVVEFRQVEGLAK